jgi:hypothetical protein
MGSAVGPLVRRWYVTCLMLLGMVLSAWHVAQLPGVYLAQVNVVLLAPQETTPVNVLGGTAGKLTDLAGITAKSVQGGVNGGKTVSSEVTLAAQGIREGWLVRQPNEGGQWNYSFSKPMIDVQVTGHSEQFVIERLNAVVAMVGVDIRRREVAAGVAEDNYVRTILSPAQPEVFFNDGDRRRALLGLLGAGGLLTYASAYGVDRVLSRRERRRPLSSDV